MVHEWYEDEKNVKDLASFLKESGELATEEDIKDLLEHPEKYTDVWKIYRSEILGLPTPVTYGEPYIKYSELPSGGMRTYSEPQVTMSGSIAMFKYLGYI